MKKIFLMALICNQTISSNILANTSTTETQIELERTSKKGRRAKAFFRKCFGIILSGIVAIHCAKDEEKREEALAHMLAKIEYLINSHDLSNEEVTRYMNEVDLYLSKALTNESFTDDSFHILPE